MTPEQREAIQALRVLNHVLPDSINHLTPGDRDAWLAEIHAVLNKFDQAFATEGGSDDLA